MNTSETIRLARKHYVNMDNGGMKSSAAACLSDAIALHDDGNYESAAMWARKSLAYSVGVFHADYKKVA